MQWPVLSVVLWDMLRGDVCRVVCSVLASVAGCVQCVLC